MTRPNLRVLLVCACALLCAALLAACGGSDDTSTGAAAASSPQATLEKTFTASTTSIDRASVVGSVRLDPEGLLKLGGPLALRVTGPFAAPAGGRGPAFDLDFLATLGGQKFKGAAISTGTQSFLKLDDSVYALSSEKRRARAKDDGPHAGLRSLGIDPLKWVRDVRRVGEERVAGVDTEHLAGGVDAKRLLADIGELLGTAGGGGSGPSFLSPDLLDQIGDAVKSAKVDIWTGAEDSILRQLAVAVTFAFKDAQSPIVGLDGGKIALKVRLDDVNGAPVKVAAPSAAKPLTEVTGKGGLGALLGGLGAGITGGIGGGAVELVGCVSSAGGSSVDLVRCVSKLSP